MKITQNDNSMIINTSGVKNIIIGLIFAVVGTDCTVYFLRDFQSYMPVLFGCIFGIVGVALVFFSKSKKVIIEKDKTILTEKYVIGGKPDQQTIATADIVAVSLNTSTNYNKDAQGNSSNTRTSYLALLLKNNDMINIASSSGNINLGGLRINGLNIGSIGSLLLKAPLSKEAEQIAAFLQVPVKTGS